MIRFRRLDLALLNDWLVDQRVASTYPPYRLRVWKESHDALAAIHDELVAYVGEAFEDARRHLRRGFEDELSPFTATPIDPAANYPALVHRVTQQGYLGELLAVLAVEHWGAHRHNDWAVPACLFRLHNQEFQHLDSINARLQEGEAVDQDATSEQRPGRTGNDALAFRMNDQSVITCVLTLEAKCLARNSQEKIDDAHRQLSSAPARPSGILELVRLLEDYDTTAAQVWQHALLQLYREGYRGANRFDGIAYACGRAPSRNGRTSWLSATAPSPNYIVQRKLEGMEFQLEDLTGVVDTRSGSAFLYSVTASDKWMRGWS